MSKIFKDPLKPPTHYFDFLYFENIYKKILIKIMEFLKLQYKLDIFRKNCSAFYISLRIVYANHRFYIFQASINSLRQSQGHHKAISYYRTNKFCAGCNRKG